ARAKGDPGEAGVEADGLPGQGEGPGEQGVECVRHGQALPSAQLAGSQQGAGCGQGAANRLVSPTQVALALAAGGVVQGAEPPVVALGLAGPVLLPAEGGAQLRGEPADEVAGGGLALGDGEGQPGGEAPQHPHGAGGLLLPAAGLGGAGRGGYSRG